jgi:Domain of unknown function (DUF3473)
MQTSIFSVDVEDWFHILDDPSVPTIDQWSTLPSHVEKNFSKLLDIFSEKNVQVTCFFLGWVAERGHGGMRLGQREPHRVGDNGTLLEVPITVADLLGRPMCFFGGGYLRLFPYWLIRRMALQVLSEGRPVVFYIHPREIDPLIRLPMSRKRRFKSYVNLGTTELKVRRIL